MRMIRLARACVSIAVLAFVSPATAHIKGAHDHADFPSVAGPGIVCFDRSECDRDTIPTRQQERDTIESRAILESDALTLSHIFDTPDISTPRIKRTNVDAPEGSAQNRRVAPVEMQR